MFDKQQANSIFWSPQGQFLVLAGLRRSVLISLIFGCDISHACIKSYNVFSSSMNGALAFVDTSDCTMMNIAEHYMASDVEWDPTGRYVVTSVSWWSHKVICHNCVLARFWISSVYILPKFAFWSLQVDNAFWLWTFQGRLLQKNNKDRFCQLLWRPRPPSLLTHEQIKVRWGCRVIIITLSAFSKLNSNPTSSIQIHSSSKRIWRNTPRSLSRKIDSVNPRLQR